MGIVLDQTPQEEVVNLEDTLFPPVSMKKMVVGFFGTTDISIFTKWYTQCRIRRHLRLLYRQGHRHFLVGTGTGFSMMVLQELVALRQHLVCYVYLMEPQGFTGEGWGTYELADYHCLREQVSMVIHVGGYSPAELPTRIHRKLMEYGGRMVYLPGRWDEETRSAVRLARECQVHAERLLSLPYRGEARFLRGRKLGRNCVRLRFYVRYRQRQFGC